MDDVQNNQKAMKIADVSMNQTLAENLSDLGETDFKSVASAVPPRRHIEQNTIADNELQSQSAQKLNPDVSQSVSDFAQNPGASSEELIARERQRKAEYQKQWRASNREYLKAAPYEQRNHKRIAARRKLRQAVHKGKIVKPLACEDCGVTGRQLGGHHHDYSRALDVTWLCSTCHSKRHAEDERGGKKPTSFWKDKFDSGAIPRVPQRPIGRPRKNTLQPSGVTSHRFTEGATP